MTDTTDALTEPETNDRPESIGEAMPRMRQEHAQLTQKLSGQFEQVDRLQLQLEAEEALIAKDTAINDNPHPPTE